MREERPTSNICWYVMERESLGSFPKLCGPISGEHLLSSPHSLTTFPVCFSGSEASLDGHEQILVVFLLCVYIPYSLPSRTVECPGRRLVGQHWVLQHVSLHSEGHSCSHFVVRLMGPAGSPCGYQVTVFYHPSVFPAEEECLITYHFVFLTE